MRRRTAVALVLGAGLTLSACSTTSGGSAATSSDGTVRVVASINAWGSILTQLGGSHVQATSIITNPDTDPHDYEPTQADGRAIAAAQLVVENGIGYDGWAQKAVAANPDPSRMVVNVGDVVGVPDGGNPHRWYSPTDVETVANTITADLKKLDPTNAAYFDQQRATFENTGLAQYHQLIATIRSTYSGTPIGASESIVTPLADALGLDLITPPSFLKAISEGSDPSAADKSAIDRQIADRQIKVYVYNSQNATPDVQAQVTAARKAGIQVTTVTETLSPAGDTFQQWQVAQLQALQRALQAVTT